jgi:hypothetical protein
MALNSIFKPLCEGLQGISTIAYFTTSPAVKKKGFITLTKLVVNIIKLIS